MSRKAKHQAQLKRAKEQEDKENEYLRKATLLFLHVGALYLRDKKGYGSKRLGDFVEGSVEILDSISLGDIDFMDIRNTLYEETGVEIDFVGADNNER